MSLPSGPKKRIGSKISLFMPTYSLIANKRGTTTVPLLLRLVALAVRMVAQGRILALQATQRPGRGHWQVPVPSGCMAGVPGTGVPETTTAHTAFPMVGRCCVIE